MTGATHSVDAASSQEVLVRGFRLVALIVFALVSFQIFAAVYFAAPQPFVDEEFHVPQAIKYCEGNFSTWDPKLTTLPGLYFVSLALWKAVNVVLPAGKVCTLWNLRLTNVLLSALGVPLFYVVIRDFHRLSNVRLPHWKVLLLAVNFATFPVMYFFAFLYYTDQASTFFVFLMAFLHFRKSRNLAALAGAVAVFTRQTNIIWVVYFALLEVFASYKVIMGSVMKKSDLRTASSDEDLQVLLAPFLSLRVAPSTANLGRIAGYFLGVVLESFPRILGYLFVMIGFVIFLMVNEGIVVGDRSAHQAVFHLPQLLYFSSFTMVFASPYLCTPSKVKRFLRTCYESPFAMLIALKAIVFSIHYYTYVHQYLISDNRHYTFYIWKRIFERDERIKYVLAPVYLYGLWAIYDELKPHKFFRTALFFLVTAVILIPQKLLEFRYFILPFLVFRLHVPNTSLRQIALEFMLFQTVNAATLYVFVHRPFAWSHSEGVQHFMW